MEIAEEDWIFEFAFRRWDFEPSSDVSVHTRRAAELYPEFKYHDPIEVAEQDVAKRK